MLSLDKQNELRERYRAENPGWQPATELFAASVHQRLQEQSVVLDIGCGRGGLVEQLGHPLTHMVGIDPDWASLAEHRLAMPRVVGLSATIPLPTATVDVAYASWVLEHLPQPIRDLGEIARVLRPGGVFVFITPNARHPLIRLNRVFGQITTIQHRLVAALYGRAEVDTFPVSYHANTVSVLYRLVHRAGLRVVALEAVADPTYLAFNEPLFRLMCRVERWISAENRLHLVGILQKPVLQD
ncbi:MAG: class I SAM-dependent methyltransferase [Anaerolineae bacterium]|nr:class I SAM-dependent methyltransferase [Anaerolineae bacterium]